MNIPRSVIVDLLPLYLDGELSQETRAFIEGFLETDPELAALANQSADELFGDVRTPLTQEDEMKALNQAKRYAFWRTVIIAAISAFFALVLIGGVIMILLVRGAV
jgi:anti-sigma factor RsiW